MFLIVGDLASTTILGDVDQCLDRIGDHISEKHALPIEVAGRAACGLDQGSFVAEETFFVCIEDNDKGDLRKIETFTEEVDPDENVKCRGT